MKAQLTPIPFPTIPDTIDNDIDAPTNNLKTIQTQLHNNKIIDNKPSEPVYNKQLLKALHVPILDLYDMDTLTNRVLRDKQINDV